MMQVISSSSPHKTTSFVYSAFGYVLGHLKLDPSSPKMGKLLLTDGTILPVYLFQQSKLEQISLDSLYAWRIYFRTDGQKNLSGLKLVEAIAAEDETRLAKPLPSYAALDHFRIRGRIHNIWKNQISLRLERNNIPAGKEDLPQWRPFYITVFGKLEQKVNKGDAIEITARREGMQLQLVEANKIAQAASDSQTSATKKQQKDKAKLETSSKSETVATATTATPETSSFSGVIMINGKTPEVTIKFNDRPQLPETGKKVTLQVTGDNGIVVRADMNRKTLQKNVEKMDSYEAWTAAMSGKIVKIDADGVIVLEGAGINVFERKTKEKTDNGDGSGSQSEA